MFRWIDELNKLNKWRYPLAGYQGLLKLAENPWQKYNNLFKLKSILLGMSSSIDIWGNLYRHKIKNSFINNDYTALKSDWEAIGKDMKNAIRSYSDHNDELKISLDNINDIPEDIQNAIKSFRQALTNLLDIIRSNKQIKDDLQELLKNYQDNEEQLINELEKYKDIHETIKDIIVSFKNIQNKLMLLQNNKKDIY